MQFADAVAYSPHLRKLPLRGVPAKPLIIQFARGDQTVPNPATTAMLRAGDLADRAMTYTISPMPSVRRCRRTRTGSWSASARPGDSWTSAFPSSGRSRPSSPPTAPRSSFHSPPASLRCRARRHCPKIWVPYVERPRYGTAATAAGSAPDRGPGGPRWITGGESRDRAGRGRRSRVGDRGDRRVAELDSGAVKTIPWAEVRRRLTGR